MMAFSIFWLIENSVWINVSKFWWKFHEKATSGNTGLKFFLESALLMPVFIPEMQIMEKLSPVLPEVTFLWNFHQNFDTFIHAEFSINQKMKTTIIF